MNYVSFQAVVDHHDFIPSDSGGRAGSRGVGSAHGGLEAGSPYYALGWQQEVVMEKFEHMASQRYPRGPQG